MGLLLAIASSISWGTSDYFGGVASRTIDSLVAVLFSQFAAMVAVLTIVIATGGLTLKGALVNAVIAGLVGPLALILYYRALAIGPMGIVGPINATSGAVPVIYGFLIGESISALQWIGVLGCIAGVTIVSSSHITSPHREDLKVVAMSIASALGFGIVYIFLARSASAGTMNTLAIQRITNVIFIGALLLIGKKKLKFNGVRGGIFLSLIGILDVSANGFYIVAAARSSIAIAGAIGATYPLATTALAAKYSKERLSLVQYTGAALTIASIVAASL
ncbi:MAG: EamA family transporter [Actinomycetota bacterium]|nr:EamA family transporter [Actinomycetota bacterium]